MKKELNYIIIIGCGKLGLNLAENLYDQGNDVLVIDKDEKALDSLPSTFGGLSLNSNGTDLDTLTKANIDKADAVIAVTNNDNVNIMACLLAREIFKVKKVIARVYLPEREIVYSDLGVETICPTFLSVKAINDCLNITENNKEVA